MISSSLRRSAREVVIRSYSYPRSLLQNAASGPGPWPGPGRPGAQRPARWVLQNTRREVGIGSGYKTVGVCCGHTTIANDLRHHLRFRSRLAASIIVFVPSIIVFCVWSMPWVDEDRRNILGNYPGKIHVHNGIMYWQWRYVHWALGYVGYPGRHF